MLENFYFRYCGAYLVNYVGIMIAALVVVLFLRIELNSGLSIALAYASACYPAHLFVKDMRRIPEKSEKRKFAVGSLAAVTALSVFLLMILAMYVYTEEEIADFKQSLEAAPLWVFPVVLAFVLGLYYLAIGFAFGSFAKISLKALEKKQGG